MKDKWGTNSKQAPNIWAVGGGKGGVGKTFISSNLAISLAKMNQAVTIVDLDLGGANLHTYLGSANSTSSLSDLLAGRVNDINELVTPSSIPNLNIVSGFNDALNIADVTIKHRDLLLQQIGRLKTPHIILDLGAGTAEHTLDFFLAAHKKIIAVTPEPTSIENAYRFIKSSFYRQLKRIEEEGEFQDVIRSAMDNKNELGIRSPADLILHVSKMDQMVGFRLMEAISEFEVNLILNQVRSRGDVELGHSIKSVCRKYFGIEVNYTGYVNYDNAVWQALRKKRPISVEYPFSEVVGQFLAITRYLVNPQSMKAVV
jgi:flagellar biosynthesis protein FlhG